MRKTAFLSFLAATNLLAACGGGGGDSRPIVSPPPPPSSPQPDPQPAPEPQPEPPATPETVHNLQGNRTFSALTSSSNVTVSRTSGQSTSGSVSAGTLSVNYNAVSKSYTVNAPGYSSTFSPANIDKETIDNFVAYVKESDTGNQQLILLKTSLDGTAGAQHVGMGLMQRNTLRPAETDMLFNMFVYGFEAPLTAVPRTGTGSFRIDVFGLTTSPDYEPRVFEGIGRFDLDFGVGVFSTRTELRETGILTGASESGTDFELTGTGKLDSTDGTFSGQVAYSGVVGIMPGTISGRFYGPDAREMGATFSASSNNGSTVVGGMTGSWLSDAPSTNLTLTKLVVPELISTDHAYMVTGTGEPLSGNSQLYLRPDGSLEFTSGIPSLRSVALTTESRIASADTNFTAYEKNVEAQTVRLEMYKTGQTNTELKLTYASFGQWQSAPQSSVLADGDRVFFVYGLRTPEGALTHRTGSARYEGVAYGTAFNTGTSARYNVSGTSRFDVNFSDRTYQGNLALAGSATRGTDRVDFGTYQFGGAVDHMNKMHSLLQQDGSPVGRLQAGFYGPNGEEIAGSFEAAVTDRTTGSAVSIVGAAAATQR